MAAQGEAENMEKQQEPQEQPQEPQQSCYAAVCAEPTQEAADGIRFDFCEGLRVRMPEEGGPWRIVFKDLDTDTLLYNQDAQPKCQINSVKKYYVRFRLEIYRKADFDVFAAAAQADPSIAANPANKPKPIFAHDYDCKGKTVMIQLPVPTMGDTMGWFPYVEKFRVKHQCHVVAVLDKRYIPLFRKTYPDIEFTTVDHVQEYHPYACYYIGLFFKGDDTCQPYDFRFVGLHRTAGYILGVDPTEERPRFDLSAPRKIAEPYVCIASQSSSQAKYWNNPSGWREVVQFLKNSGYRVLCVDKDHEAGSGIVYNHIPYGAEDFTGALPLQERVDLIKDADFFIGLSSGLSWLAWGCGVPVVMISGFTHPLNEFETPYRVINAHACNCCWNDVRVDFDHYDFLWCPRHKGDERQFECTRLISSAQVIDAIKRIPAFKEHSHA